MISRRRFFQIGAGLALVPASGAAYAGYIEPAVRLEVTRYRPRLPAWPSNFPLRIAIVTDIHAGGPNMSLARIEQVVETVNALKPDLILDLGDHEATNRFITPVPTRDWAKTLGHLQAPLGTFAILGNHDWWHNHSAVRGAIADAEIPLFENDAVRIEHQGRGFWLAGIGDQLAEIVGHGRFRGRDDLPGTLAKVTTDEPILLMVHEPDIFPDVPERVALTFAGHTHGAQIWFPGMTPRFIPSAYGARYRYGHIMEGGRHMIVSAGLGTSGIPVRFGVPPEIVLVELGAASRGEA